MKGNIKISDVLVTGGYNLHYHSKQFFYVFDIVDGVPYMHGISHNNLYNCFYTGWSTSRIADKKELQEFHDLLKERECVVDLNLRTIRKKYKRD